MFLLGKSSTSSKPIDYEIKIISPYKDSILIPASLPSGSKIPIRGSLEFTLPESLTVKYISLKLAAHFKLDFLQCAKHKGANLVSHFREARLLLECTWDNLIVSPMGTVRSGPDVLPCSSRSSPGGPSFELAKGRHTYAFEAELPGDLPETIEGLQCASILYRLESCIERGCFKLAYCAQKYLRIFKVPEPDNIMLSDSLTVMQLYRKELKFQAEIATRGIPIGGKVPITVYIFPFAKGYRLSNVTYLLEQQFYLQDSAGRLYDGDTTLSWQTIDKFENLKGCDSECGNSLFDVVKLETELHVPDQLKQVTQDCTITENVIRVRHKITVDISFEGLRIKIILPVFLYVAPWVPLRGRMIMVDNAGKFHIRADAQTYVFEPTPESQLPPLLQIEPNEVPPSYESRQRDQLYTDILYQNSDSHSPTPSGEWLRELSRVPSYRAQDESQNILPLYQLSPAYD
ncbi:HBL369Wp [Eremothecium sinecaudum]|uniref:HBL369Wp n=1 Tax=Eremothecium sinecaudum TaxID=45286 RepID=A0A109UW10_9SACH|nr:HBL369Wp [Eremothecium sinecaudum]AMD18533.1 HBL369Wp [Eremothecium sinecaudum]